MLGISHQETILRLLLAAILGILLGIERSKHGKPVGGRTHALICVSCALIAIISAYGFQNMEFQRDPTRLAVGVFTGIGFIGAGIIWQSKDGAKRGLTTATNIFATAAIGLTVGFGYYFLAITATIIILLLLLSSFIFSKLQQKCSNKKQDQL